MMLREPVITCSGLLRIETPTYAVARMVELFHSLTQYCLEWEYYRLQAGTGGLLGESIGLECSHASMPTSLLYRLRYIVVSLSSDKCTYFKSLLDKSV
jgi:hypothetical protein